MMYADRMCTYTRFSTSFTGPRGSYKNCHALKNNRSSFSAVHVKLPSLEITGVHVRIKSLCKNCQALKITGVHFFLGVHHVHGEKNCQAYLILVLVIWQQVEEIEQTFG